MEIKLPSSEDLDQGFNSYIGDGVYASFDGYQIWLAVGDHTNKVVALAPEVLDAFEDYQKRLAAALEKKDD